MKYVFHPEDVVSTEKIVNSPEKIKERKGEYLCPFPSLIDSETRIYERYGYLLQEQDRLKNLNWIQRDLERFLKKWSSFYADKTFYTIYRDSKGNPSFENVWNGFLDYLGKKEKYRMRKEKSNRDVLQNQLKIKANWSKNSGDPFPGVLVEEKIKSIISAIKETQENIAKTETALEVLLILLREKLEKTEEGRVDRNKIYDSLVEEIKNRAKEALEGTASSQKPSEEI